MNNLNMQDRKEKKQEQISLSGGASLGDWGFESGPIRKRLGSGLIRDTEKVDKLNRRKRKLKIN